MAKAKKLPSGSWRVRTSVGKDANGRYIYKSFTAPTKKEAEYMASEYMLKTKDAIDKKILGALIDEYIDNRENILSPSTIQGYRKIRRTTFQSIMDIPVDKIDNAILQKAINEESKRLSPKSIANAYGLISTVLSQNTYYRYTVTKPKKQKKIKNLPEPADIMRIVKGTEIELPCLLAMWLSFRMSEIKGFRKQDIVDGVITVNNTMIYVNREYILKPETKTPESRRSIKLPEYILSLINDLPEEQEFLVALSGQAIYKRFSVLLERNNIPHITFHDLRSVNASVMHKLNVPDKYAMERGGWETDSILKSVYQQTFSNERLEVDKKIDAFFNDLI